MATSYIQNQTPPHYGVAISLMVENLINVGWSYQGSGDGLTGFSSSGKIFTGTGSGSLGWNNPGAWALVRDPTGVREFTFQHNALGGVGIKYSPFAKFSGGSAIAVPTATDEKNMRTLTTASAVVTISAAGPAVVTWSSHGLVAGSVVMFTSTGTLPAPLVPNTPYYVSQTGVLAGSFQLAATPAGASISTAGGGGSGSHTAYGQLLNTTWLPTSIAIGLNAVLYGAAKDVAPYGWWFAATQSSPVTFTNGSANVGWTAHGLALGSVVTFTTAGTLPTNFSSGVNYYVIAVAANTFTVAATLGATAILAGSAGTGTHIAYGPRTSLVFDPVVSVAEDPDPYVIHVGASNAFSMSVLNYGRNGNLPGTWSVTTTANGGTTEGCFAIMDASRVQFLYVQPAGYALSATGGTASAGFVVNGVGLAANPFNSKQDPLPFPYVRIQDNLSPSVTTVSPGLKGWSTLARWTGTAKLSFLDNLDAKNWICAGPFWLPWDGTTTPIG